MNKKTHSEPDRTKLTWQLVDHIKGGGGVGPVVEVDTDELDDGCQPLGIPTGQGKSSHVPEVAESRLCLTVLVFSPLRSSGPANVETVPVPRSLQSR